MTRKDFEVIAAVLQRTKPRNIRDEWKEYAIWRGIVIEFGEQLKLENARFNRTVFEKACGVE